MKELSIEEKAKAYDEALERAKKVHKYSSDIAEIKRIEEIFPELKESEDEKVKQKIINLIKKSNKVGGWALHKWEADEMLAWLEKQGQKPVNDTDEGIVEAVKDTSILDMIQPKFKVGDWVVIKVNGTENVRQIVRIEYFANGQPQYISSNGLWFGNGTEARLWTIQNAKDGDVLAVKGAPFIYKKHDKDYIYLYCGVNLSNEFVEAKRIDIRDNNNIYPATKEQHDTLFAKMREEGYMWDAEKKELKLLITNGGDFESETCEQKSTKWSKEDESIALGIEQIVNCASLLNIAPDKLDKVRNWLKSLKERIGE